MSAAYASFSIKVSILFCLLVISGTLQAQNVFITPGANPSSVVVMGNTLTFTTDVMADASISNAEMEVEVPDGFELLVSTPNFKSGSLTNNNRTGRILIASLSQNSPVTLTVHVKALCNAETATTVENRTIKYSLYRSDLPSPLGTKATIGIQNFNKPILNVVPPPSDVVSLNTTYTRTFTIVQTKNYSHVNNIEVKAACDVSGFKISKVQVRRNGTKAWTEVAVETGAGAYRYVIKRGEVFTPANGYPNQQLGYNDTLQILETVSMLKCDAGNLNYSISYGDATTFCSPAEWTGTVVYSQHAYAYTPDIYAISYSAPGGPAPAKDGRFVTGVINNSTQAEATMHDLYIDCFGVANYRFRSAYFTNNSGTPILNGTDTVFIPITRLSYNQYHITINDLNNPALKSYYEARGLRDLDGDGRYGDLPKGNTFYFAVRYNYELNTGCSNELAYPWTRVFRLCYKNFCRGGYLTYERNYSAGENNSTTNAWQGGFSFGSIQNIAMSNASLSVNAQSRVSGNLYYDGNGSVTGLKGPTLFNLAVNGVSSYYSTIVLPTGLSFDNTQSNPVIIGSSAVPTTSYTVNSRKDTIRIKWTANWGYNNYIFNIAVKNNGTVDNSKTLRIYHEYDYGNTGVLHKFGCLSVAVPYLQVFPCSYLGITSFNIERRSFGYTNINKTTRVTDPVVARNNGYKMDIVSPYDDVDMEGQFKAATNISTGSANKIFIKFSYVNGSALFDTVPNSLNGVSLYYNNSSTPIQIPSSAMTKKLASGTQSVELDIAPYLNKAGINLSTNDVLKVVMHLRATSAYPTTGVDFSAQMQATTVIGSNTYECSPLMDVVRIWNSDWSNKSTCDGNLGGCIGNFNHYATYNSSALGFVIWWSTGQNNVWGNEYRPNGDNFSKIVVRYPNLLKINSITKVLRDNIRGNMTTGAVSSSTSPGYKVEHSAGYTYITIDSLVTRDCMSSISSSGFGYQVNFDMINPTVGNMNTAAYTLSFDNYPTSAAPRRDKYTNASYNLVANGGQFDYPYKYVITPIQANVAPVSTRAEWTIRLTNQSNFLSSSSTLPNSWLAVECPPKVVPQELRNASTGTPISASFVKYASGAVDKYWIKIGTITANPTVDYILSCTYEDCTGTPTLKLRYGMSKVDYPTNPDAGYSNYGSPGKLAGVVSTNISYTPPEVKYAGRLTHTTDAANGANTFCAAVQFEGEYSNGVETNVGRLQIRVPLPKGASYHSTYTPQVKFGNGGWANVASVDQSKPGELLIILDDSKELLAFGSPNNGDKAWVRYALFIGCGIKDEIQFPAEFIGYSGCGTRVPENVVDVAQLKIAGLSPPPDYSVQDLKLMPNASAPYIYTSGSSPTDGAVDLSCKYVLAGVAVSNVIAIIDLPPNLKMTSHGGDLSFTQSGTRLTADLPSSGSIGTIYNLQNIHLVPENPAEWTEDSVTIYLRTGIKFNMSCNSQVCVMTDSTTIDSIRFALKKLDVRFSDSIAARSSYGSSSTEHVVIDGWLVNEGVSSYFDADALNLDLWHSNNGTSWFPVSGAGVLRVNNVNHDDSVAFRIIADVPSNANVCNMAVVLRKHNSVGSSKNSWLADSVAIVIPPPVYEIMSQPASICPMAVDAPIGDAAISGYTYSWNPADYLSSTTAAPAKFTYDYKSHPVVNDTVLQYRVTITRPKGCNNADTVFVPLRGIPSVDAISDKVLCHGGKLSVAFADATNTSSHPDSLTTFTWATNKFIKGLSSPGNGNIVDSVLANLATAPKTVTITVTPTKKNCAGVSKDFSVKVFPISLNYYPDIRIRACPTTGMEINLTKYIDTLELTKLEWSLPIKPSGNLPTNYIAFASVRTYTYTVQNTCLASPVTRKIYVERLSPNRMRPYSDTITICYERAQMVQINQLFGIDANGSWNYYSINPNDINAYVTKSYSPAYGGSVVMNGEAIYEDNSISKVKYHGIDVKKAVFTYTSAPDSCLGGKSYTIVIMLTPDLTK
jgi:hypothetical protein